MGVAATMKIEAFLAGAWVDLRPDTIADAGPLTIKYGIDGHGPADVVAAPGSLAFYLRNDAGGSGGVQGYYSPRHSNCRSGWGFGVAIRVSFTSGALTDEVKFRGTVKVIDPVPGRYGKQWVRVVAEDGAAALLDADVRELVTQTDKTEAELIDLLLDSLPAASQPVARDIDDGTNLCEVAFDDLGGGAKALALIGDLARSAQGKAFIRGDGTFVYRNRHNVGALNTSAVSFDDTMHGLVAPSSTDRCYNKVRVTTRRKTVSSAATDLLYDGSVQLGAGEPRVVWCEYTDPSPGDRQTKCGGVDVVTTLVAGTHYFAGVETGGTGLTAQITCSLEAFASSGRFTVENTGAQTAHVTLRIYGKAIRDLGPTTVEASAVAEYGERVLALDLKYQASALFGASLADYLIDVYATIANQIDAIDFIANENSTFMQHALEREPGDLITISETVTGIAAAKALIQSVELTVTGNVWIRCRWHLAPGSTLSTPWRLGDATYGQLGNSTTLGL